jgi:hypothetical protein
MPIEQIQKFLGHSKLETTQVYAESSTEMMRESYQRALSHLWRVEGMQRLWMILPSCAPWGVRRPTGTAQAEPAFQHGGRATG